MRKGKKRETKGAGCIISQLQKISQQEGGQGAVRMREKGEEGNWYLELNGALLGFLHPSSFLTWKNEVTYLDGKIGKYKLA